MAISKPDPIEVSSWACDNKWAGVAFEAGVDESWGVVDARICDIWVVDTDV